MQLESTSHEETGVDRGERDVPVARKKRTFRLKLTRVLVHFSGISRTLSFYIDLRSYLAALRYLAQPEAPALVSVLLI